MPLFNPFCKCLHPKRIVNQYTHECMTVPCGKCKACVLAKNSRYAFQCDLESHYSKHTVFVTLTYRNSSIPRAQFVDSIVNPFGADMIDVDSGEFLTEVNMLESHREALLKKFRLFGSVPYLRKTDLQLFFKRFRYYVEKQLPKEKVRYFAVGEYGPVHFRPHYHVLLFLSSDEALQICSKAVSEAWPFGRIDCQVSKGKCSSYVAGYVNSSCLIPEVFKARPVCPFCVHSRKLGQGFLQGQREKVYSSSPRDFIKRSIILNGKYKEFDVWRSAYAYFYPKCKGYVDKSSCERAYSYQLYKYARQSYPAAESAFEIARQIVSDIVYFYDVCKSDPLIKYFYGSVDADDITHSIHRVYTELLLSKHFLYFVCNNLTLSEVNHKIRLIDTFYKELDYMHLKEFFEAQQLFYESDLVGDEDLFTDQWENSYYPFFYDNCYFDIKVLEKTPCYLRYLDGVNKLFNDRIKHKELNDLNKIFFVED